MSTSKSWDVNTTPRNALAPYPWSHGVKTSVWLRAKEMEISAAQWALRLEKDFTFTFTALVVLVKTEQDSFQDMFEVISMTHRISEFI